MEGLKSPEEPGASRVGEGSTVQDFVLIEISASSPPSGSVSTANTAMVARSASTGRKAPVGMIAQQVCNSLQSPCCHPRWRVLSDAAVHSVYSSRW